MAARCAAASADRRLGEPAGAAQRRRGRPTRCCCSTGYGNCSTAPGSRASCRARRDRCWRCSGCSARPSRTPWGRAPGPSASGTAATWRSAMPVLALMVTLLGPLVGLVPARVLADRRHAVLGPRPITVVLGAGVRHHRAAAGARPLDRLVGQSTRGCREADGRWGEDQSAIFDTVRQMGQLPTSATAPPGTTSSRACSMAR